MKTILLSILLLPILAMGGDIVCTNVDMQNVPQGVRSVYVYYLGAPTATASNLVTRDRVVKTTASNGYFAITNYQPGIYRFEHQGTYTTTTNWFSFPATNGTVNAADPQWGAVATNGLSGANVVYSQGAANARFYPSNNPAGFAPSNTLGTAAYSNSTAFAQIAGSNYFSGFLNDNQGPTNTAIVRGIKYSSITNAVAAAVAGDTVFVNPGIYYEHNLLKKGVNYWFSPGSKLVWFCTLQTLADGYAFFDERSTGATTNTIFAPGTDAYFSYGTNYDPVAECTGNTNAVGLIVLATNPLTRLDVTLHDVDGDAFPDQNPVLINGVQGLPSLFYISKTARTTVQVNDMKDSLRDWSTAQGIFANRHGFYWEAGETYFTSKHIDPANDANGSLCYAIWANDLSTDQHSDNFWVNGNICEGFIYNSLNSTNIRVWYSFDENVVTNESAYNIIGGKTYIVGKKIASSSSGQAVITLANTTVNAQAWVTAQKITAATGVVWINVSSGNLFYNVQQFEGPGSGLTGAAGGAIGSDLSFSNYVTAATSRTMPTRSGKVLLAAGSKTFTVTDSLVTTSSTIQATINAVDTTATSVVVVPANGSFTLTVNANATANLPISWSVVQF